MPAGVVHDVRVQGAGVVRMWMLDIVLADPVHVAGVDVGVEGYLLREGDGGLLVEDVFAESDARGSAGGGFLVVRS